MTANETTTDSQDTAIPVAGLREAAMAASSQGAETAIAGADALGAAKEMADVGRAAVTWTAVDPQLSTDAGGAIAHAPSPCRAAALPRPRLLSAVTAMIVARGFQTMMARRAANKARL